MTSTPVSTSVRLVAPVLLFALGAYAMLRWSASCGFTLGENVDAVQGGRACGAARSGTGMLLPFVAFLPAMMRSSQRFYLATAGVLMLNLMVIFGLAPAALLKQAGAETI